MFIPYRLLAIAAVAGDEPTRYAIHGVNIERDSLGHPVMTATNGHALLCAKWIETPPNPTLFASEQETVDGFTTIIPKEHALRMLKFINKKAADNEPSCGTVVLDEINTGDKVLLETADGALSSRIESTPIKEPFPPYSQVFRKYTILKGDDNTAVRIAVNPELLADLLDAMAKAAPSSRGVVLTVPTKPNHPILLDLIGNDGEKLSGVLMPVDDDTISDERVKETKWDEKPTTAEMELGGLSAGVARAVKNMVPKKGEGSVTMEFSGPGMETKSVTFDQSNRERVIANCDAVIQGKK